MRYNSEMVLGLDIGSAQICAALCELDNTGNVNLKGVGTSNSAGLIKGQVVDIDELYKSIDKAIKKARHGIKARPTYVITNIPFHGIQFSHNLGFILSKEESGQISESEKKECIRRSGNIFKSSDQKILHIFPLFFKVDGTIVKNPVGTFGNNLEVQTHIILGNSSNIMKVTKVLKEFNLHISGLIYDPLACAQIFLDSNERKNGAVLIDIGGQFTKVSIFKNNLLHLSLIIPIGGETISSDIAICLKTTVPEAERLKILKGDILLSNINQEEEIEIFTRKNGLIKTKKLLLCKIIEARINELLSIIKKEIPFTFEHQYKCVITGGGSKLTGLREYIEAYFDSTVRNTPSPNAQHIIDNITHANAIGLILYAIKTGALPYSKNSRKIIPGFIKKWLNNLF